MVTFYFESARDESCGGIEPQICGLVARFLFLYNNLGK
jgi:hypothetical protein